MRSNEGRSATRDLTREDRTPRWRKTDNAAAAAPLAARAPERESPCNDLAKGEHDAEDPDHPRRHGARSRCPRRDAARPRRRQADRADELRRIEAVEGELGDEPEGEGRHAQGLGLRGGTALG